MKKKIIEFKDFSFQYRVQAEPTVKNINLSIYIVSTLVKLFIL